MAPIEPESLKEFALVSGALISTVYVLGEVIKALVFSKRRKDEAEKFECRFLMKGEKDLAKFECQFMGIERQHLGEMRDLIKGRELIFDRIIDFEKRIAESNEKLVEKLDDQLKLLWRMENRRSGE